jgi:transposase
LEKEGIESFVVDPASIATSRRMKRAKTDRIDGEALVRALLAYKRGEPRVCSMVRPPSPEEEDRRRRERKAPITERVRQATGSRDCCSRKGSTSMSRCGETDERGLRHCALATAASCRRT